MLSTKMMPAVGVLIPIYLLCRDLGLLDNVTGLIIIYTLMNLPIAVWMSYTYFCEVPAAILEAGRIDGAGTLGRALVPSPPYDLTRPFFDRADPVIFAWNEAFWSINLTSANAAPLTASSLPIRVRKGSSGRSFQRRLSWRSLRSWCLAGLRKSNLYRG